MRENSLRKVELVADPAKNFVVRMKHGGNRLDILFVNGDPLKDISIMTKPEENLVLIMKDGKIYNNTAK